MVKKNTQLKHGCRNNTPKNNDSYHKAVKQMKGNIKWGLEFLSPLEISGFLAESFCLNINQDVNSPEEQYIHLNLLEQVLESINEYLSQKKARLISTCGSDLLEVNSRLYGDVLVIRLALRDNYTMTHSSHSQEFAKDQEIDKPAINLFTEDYDWEELFCPDCYKKQRPEKREVNGFIELRCPDCDSGLCLEKLLDEAGEIIENQREAGNTDSSKKKSSVPSE